MLKLTLWMLLGLSTGCMTVPRMKLDSGLANSKEIKVTSQPGMTGSGALIFGPYKVTKIKPGPTSKMKASAGDIASGEKTKKTYIINWEGPDKSALVNCSRISQEAKALFAGSHASTSWTCVIGDEGSPEVRLTTTQKSGSGTDIPGLAAATTHNGDADVWGTKVTIQSSNTDAEGASGRTRTGYNLLIDGKVVAAADLGGDWSFWVANEVDSNTQTKLALIAALMFIDSQVTIS